MPLGICLMEVPCRCFARVVINPFPMEQGSAGFVDVPLDSRTQICTATASVARMNEGCVWCRFPVSINVDVCPNCGAYRKEDDKDTWVKSECPFCHTPVTKCDNKCSNCGAQRDPKNSAYSASPTSLKRTTHAQTVGHIVTMKTGKSG
jgi:hypothetical protein